GVHSNPDVEVIDKFCHLMGSLEGDAKKAIDGFLITEDNYQPAVDMIKKCFGKRGPIVSDLIHQLMGIKCASGSSGFTNYVREVEAICRQLEALQVNCNNEFVGEAIIKNLPDFARAKVIEAKQGNDEWDTQALREKLFTLAEWNEAYHQSNKNPN